ncbi:hypothetical protein MSG28_016069 [Choristoneura fumiferana]|uniref:Uncharacterized protein n=1 Tax=Choristoneura fumiferana TaxID=7141 RepID=A0ACC0K5B7_CHOFU|nr:hypothetical protein MSG28_016069 [Choristoneura fumiferana]
MEIHGRGICPAVDKYMLRRIDLRPWAETLLYGIDRDRKFTNFGYTQGQGRSDQSDHPERLNIWFTRFYKDARPHYSWQAFLPHHRRLLLRFSG